MMARVIILFIRYVIGEDVAFNTAHGRFREARLFRKQSMSNDLDMIAVEGDTVELYTGGPPS